MDIFPQFFPGISNMRFVWKLHLRLTPTKDEAVLAFLVCVIVTSIVYVVVLVVGIRAGILQLLFPLFLTLDPETNQTNPGFLDDR